mmetsp:Transcript_33592/g.102697  ORF Transcript_33592/g.102697 Transcript_33592/m.102697 type:complete len:221 (-) Transcript_33592:1150-1812(-)
MPAEWDAREGRRQAERVVGQVKGVAARPAGHRRRPAARDARIEADVHEALILHAEHQQHEVESGEGGEHARLPAKMRPRDEGAAEDEVGCQHKYRHRRGVHRAHQPRLRVARPPKREVPKVARRSPVGVRRDETDERPAEEQRAEPRDARVPQPKGGAAQLEASHRLSVQQAAPLVAVAEHELGQRAERHRHAEAERKRQRERRRRRRRRRPPWAARSAR